MALKVLILRFVILLTFVCVSTIFDNRRRIFLALVFFSSSFDCQRENKKWAKSAFISWSQFNAKIEDNNTFAAKLYVWVSDLLPSTCLNQIENLFYDFGFWHGEPNRQTKRQTRTFTFTLIMTIEHTEYIPFSRWLRIKSHRNEELWTFAELMFDFFFSFVRFGESICCKRKKK